MSISPPAALVFAANALPVCQIFQTTHHSENNHATWTMPVYSLAEIGLVTAPGLALFKRKDIK